MKYRTDLNTDGFCMGGGVSKVYSFLSDAPIFELTYEVSGFCAGNYPHIGYLAQKGLSVFYRVFPDGNWKPLDSVVSLKINMKSMLRKLRMYQVLIYEPLLSKIERIEVSVDQGIIDMVGKPLRRVFILGGGITYGVGVTAQGLTWSNILCRKSNLEVYNFAVYKDDYLKYLWEHKSIYEGCMKNADLFIIEGDYTFQNDSHTEKYLPLLLDEMRKSKKPILVYSLISNKDRKAKLIHLLEENEYVTFVDMAFLYSSDFVDSCTYGKRFINDAGNIEIFKFLNTYLGRLENGVYC